MGPNLHWLYQTQQFGIRPGLERTEKLLQALDLPTAGQRFIHVAGTNGKGSTCAVLQRLLIEAGESTGLFTSPHLICFNERIRDGERMISDVEIEDGLGRIRAIVADWLDAPTFFEISLALALDWFAKRNLPWVVLETGLGGRLDATNCILPQACVITRIGFDHMEHLGDTLPKIAAEKAGIIKAGVPVITGMQDPQAMAVIAARATQMQAPLLEVEAPIDGNEVPMALVGPHQGWNAALAIEATRALGFRLPAVALQNALQGVQWPGRFQLLDDGLTVLDGAHNPEAALVLAGTWKQLHGYKRTHLIVAAANDKDISGLLQGLSPIAASWHFTKFPGPRAAEPSKLREELKALQGEPRPVHLHESLEQALAATTGQSRLICGSLYLVGEALSRLLPQDKSHQPSLQ